MNTTNQHYPENLLKDYELLLSYFPSHKICRPFVVEEIKKWCKENRNEHPNILEVGSGFGETTDFILKEIKATMTLVEADKEASDLSLMNLRAYKKQIKIITEDATIWIKTQPSDSYDVFTASWTVHNFPTDQREVFLVEVARILKPGGLFVIFDKVLSDNMEEMDRVWEFHKNRLGGLSSKDGRPDLYNDMLVHEERDTQPPLVWYEHELFETMKKLGFNDCQIMLRNERDIVFVATKK